MAKPPSVSVLIEISNHLKTMADMINDNGIAVSVIIVVLKLSKKRNRMMMTNVVAPPQALTVSNELIMGALVELASNRKEGSAVANN